jgi:hypothetical protein
MKTNILTTISSSDKPTNAYIRPEGCRNCVLASVSTGWVGDSNVTTPKIAIMGDTAQSEDLHNNEPFSSGLAWHFVRHHIERLGYQRSDILFTSVLRCRLAGFGKEAYPFEAIRANAENHCRQYDDRIHAFAPNRFLITYDLWGALKTPGIKKILARHVKRALDWAADPAIRPMIFLGERPASLVYNYGFRTGNGGIKAWNGHWWDGNWPF